MHLVPTVFLFKVKTEMKYTNEKLACKFNLPNDFDNLMIYLI